MDLSAFTASRKPTPNGKMFVMLGDGSLLGLPRDERWSSLDSLRETLRNPAEREGAATEVDRGARLLTAAGLELSAVEKAAALWQRLQGEETGHFRFTNDGTAYWGGFRPFEVGGQILWIGVVAPESDFLGEIQRQRAAIVGVSGLALLSGVLMAGALARRYSRPLELLATQSARVRRLQLDGHEPVETGLTEVPR